MSRRCWCRTPAPPPSPRRDPAPGAPDPRRADVASSAQWSAAGSAAPSRTCAGSRARPGVSAHAREMVIAELAALGVSVQEDDAGRARRIGLRQPARAHPGPGPSTRCCCARTWTPCRCRRPSSPCSSTAAGRTRTRGSSAPTTRRRSRCCSPSPATSPHGSSPVGIELLFTVGRGDSARRLARAGRVAACRASSATSSTTPRRSARS